MQRIPVLCIPDLGRPVYDPARRDARERPHEWHCPVCGNPATLHTGGIHPAQVRWACAMCHWETLAAP